MILPPATQNIDDLLAEPWDFVIAGTRRLSLFPMPVSWCLPHLPFRRWHRWPLAGVLVRLVYLPQSCAAAHPPRLSDDASVKVLVLERGVHRPDDLTIKTPGSLSLHSVHAFLVKTSI